MNDQSIEQEIQAKGLTAPRVTPQDIEANIIQERYFTAADGLAGCELSTRLAVATAPLTVNPPCDGQKLAIDRDPLRLLTFCVLVLRNGFTVTGESACASPANFNAEIGRKIARDNALQKVWPLMGYALKQQLHAES